MVNDWVNAKIGIERAIAPAFRLGCWPQIPLQAYA